MRARRGSITSDRCLAGLFDAAWPDGLPPVRSVALKRWRYARPTRGLDEPVVVRDGAATLVFAADGGRRAAVTVRSTRGEGARPSRPG